MREAAWLYLRNTALGRRLRTHPRIARVLHRLGYLMLPSSCLVRSGPSAGLLLRPRPLWTTDFWEGSYEPEVQRLIASLAGPGTIFYDVGGGIGLYSLLAARKGAHVFVFEPHPANAACIVRHAEMNGLEKSISVVLLAASSESGHLSMMFTERGSQMALAAGDGGGDHRVHSVTLDEFAWSHPPPSLIKIDVEGGESEVLKGASAVFDRVRPKLVCEVHDAENRRFVESWLQARRYSPRWLGPPGQEHHLFGEPVEGAG